MAEIVGFANSFTGPSLLLEFVGRKSKPYGHAYAYSGVVAVAGSEVTLLEFKTGAHYIEAEGQAFNPSASNDDLNFKIYMNNSLMYSDVMWNVQFYNNWPRIIIPAYTEVKITAENITSPGTSRDVCYILEGVVYK